MAGGAQRLRLRTAWLEAFAQGVDPAQELRGREISRAHGPPEAGESTGDDELLPQARDDLGATVGGKESVGVGQPFLGAQATGKILQEDKQIVGVALFRG